MRFIHLVIQVDVYFEQVLLPVLPPFWSPPQVVSACSSRLYSPDLNPIEPVWASFKTRLRIDLRTAAAPFLFIANMSPCCC